MEEITNADYMHRKKVFEINSLEEYHGLNVQSNTLLIADVFENFRNILPKNTWTRTCPFLFVFFFFFVFVIRLAWQAILKKTQSKSRSLVLQPN